MGAQTEEWILELVDKATGTSAKIVGGLGAMNAAQLAAARSAVGLDQALRAVDKAKASGGGAPTAAGQLKIQDAQARAVLLAAQRDLQGRKLIDKAAKASAAEQAKAANGVATEQVKASKIAKQATADQAKSGADAYKTMTSPIDAATDALKGMGPKGAAAAVAIKTAFVVASVVILATAGALYECFKAAIEITAIRAQLMATFSALGGGAAGGARTLAIVERLGEKLPFATAKIAEWGTALQKAGLQRKALTSALQAVAAATALMGESGGAAVQDLISKLALGGAEAAQLIGTLKIGGPAARAQLAEMGLRVSDITAALGMSLQQFRAARVSAKTMGEAIEKALAKKGGGALAMQTLSLANTAQKAKEGFFSLFDGLDAPVQKMLSSIQRLAAHFMKGGDAIGAVKPTVTRVMTAIIGYATIAIDAINDGFTLAARAIGDVIDALGPVIGFFGDLFTNTAFLKGLKIQLYIVAAALGVAAIAAALFALPFIVAAVVVVAALAAVAYGIYWIVGTIVEFVSTVWNLLSAWASGAGSAASDFISGLADGIANGVGRVVGAVSGLASKALGAFRAVFDMHSPSRILLHDGEHNVAGAVAIGVDRGASRVEQSMERLGHEAGPSGSFSGGKARASIGEQGARGLPQKIFQFYNCTFGAKTQEETDSMMSDWLERMSRGAVEPEPT